MNTRTPIHPMGEIWRPVIGAPAGANPDSASITPTPPRRPARSKRMHWLVRVSYGNRLFVCALIGLTLGAHLLDIGAPAWLWALLVAQFYVYPHLLYWHARRAGNQMRAEMSHLLLDCMVSGAWVAGLGFPAWPSFILFACNNINFVVFYGGCAGLPRLAVTMSLSMALVWFSGLHYPLHPQTSFVATLLSMVTLTLYLISLAQTGYGRAMALRQSNRKLREQYQEIHALQARLREQAVRDPLTGLYNRRHLSDVLGPELARCRAAHKPLAVLLIDIDHFKSVNDTWGHAAGDTVLQALARLMLRHVRTQDMVFRYGGEEFLLLLPEASLEIALERAEELRMAFSQTPMRIDDQDLPPLTVTLSCGVAAFPQHADEGDALICFADRALYAAKEHGRNRTQIWAPAAVAAYA